MPSASVTMTVNANPGCRRRPVHRDSDVPARRLCVHRAVPGAGGHLRCDELHGEPAGAGAWRPDRSRRHAAQYPRPDSRPRRTPGAGRPRAPVKQLRRSGVLTTDCQVERVLHEPGDRSDPARADRSQVHFAELECQRGRNATAQSNDMTDQEVALGSDRSGGKGNAARLGAETTLRNRSWLGASR